MYAVTKYFLIILQTVYSSLKQMLDYEGDDMEDVFMQTFKVCSQDVFGTVMYHDLKENGDQITVNQSNKEVLIDLYVGKSISY